MLVFIPIWMTGIRNRSRQSLDIMGFGAEVFVPGHGPVGTQRDIDLMSDYINACHQAAENLVEKGTSSEDPLTLEVPQQFREWKLPSFFERNVRALREQILKDA